MRLYQEAFPDSWQSYGFQGGTLYRTKKGYAIFNRLRSELFKHYGIPKSELRGTAAISEGDFSEDLAKEILIKYAESAIKAPRHFIDQLKGKSLAAVFSELESYLTAAEVLHRGTKLLPGVVFVMAWLATQNIPITIMTGIPEHYLLQRIDNSL